MDSVLLVPFSPNGDVSIPVWVINTKSSSVVLKSGTVISNLEPAEVISNDGEQARGLSASKLLNEAVAAVHVHSSEAPAEVMSNNEEHAQDRATFPWSLEGLQLAQSEDPDISCLLTLMESSKEKPSWYDVALRTADVKTLWGMWPRLAVRDGLLSRRFFGIDEKQERWQVVLPKVLRREFLAVTHGVMTGGHLGRMKSLDAVQSRAYWSTWSSDVVQFLKGACRVHNTIVVLFHVGMKCKCLLLRNFMTNCSNI